MFSSPQNSKTIKMYISWKGFVAVLKRTRIEEWSLKKRKKRKNTLKFEKDSSKQRHLSAYAKKGEVESMTAVLQKERACIGYLCTSEKGELERQSRYIISPI